MTDSVASAPTFKSFFSSREAFDAALMSAKRLTDDGTLWWRLSTFGAIEPRLDEQQLKRVFSSDSEERRRFERILRRELTWLLELSVTNRALETGLQLFGPRLEMSSDERQELQRRLEAVSEAFLSKSLRERVLIRKTAKGPTLEEIRWDISIKKHDLQEGTINDIPYATLEFLLSHDTPDFGIPAYFRDTLASSREAVAFACHLDDIEAIIRDLEVLRENLRSLQQEKGEDV